MTETKLQRNCFSKAALRSLLFPITLALATGQPGPECRAAAAGIGSQNAVNEKAAQDPGAPGSAENTVPFQLRGGFLILVEGRIGPLSRLKFVLDTGTTHTIIDSSVAEKLSLPREEGTILNFDRQAKIGWTSVPEFEFGPVKARNLRIMVAPLNQFTQYADGVDAVVGLDLLRSTSSLRIDFARNLLTFRQRKEYDPADTAKTQALLIRLNVQGQRVCLVLDTGVGDVVLYKDRLRKNAPHLRLIQEASRAHEGWLNGQLATLPGIRIGSNDSEAQVFLLKKAPPSLPPEIDGFLGVRALKVSFVDLNFEANSLALPIQNAPTLFANRRAAQSGP